VVFASFMARPLNVLIKVFYPFSSLLVRTTRVVDKKLANTNRDISMSELSDAIDITADDDAPEEETKILKGIVKFSDIEVKEIMKSRVDVVSIDTETPFDKLIETVVESGYSRIPVFTASTSRKEKKFCMDKIAQACIFCPGKQKDQRPAPGVPGEKNTPCHCGG